MTIVKTCWHNVLPEECDHPACKRIAELERELARWRALYATINEKKCVNDTMKEQK